MKSVKEIHDMIQTGRWNNDPASISHLLDIMLAMLEHIELLESKLTPSQKLSLKVEEMAMGEIDFKKPHAFEFAKAHGQGSNAYRVCKCGMSEGNVMHV